jgi:hypothetical protein
LSKEAAIAVLNVGGIHDGKEQQAQCIHQDMRLLAGDRFAPHHSHADRCRPLFCGAFHALAIEDGGRGASLSFRLLAAGNVERVVNAIQHAIAVPLDEAVVDHAVRSKILRKLALLATSAQKYITAFMTARMSVRRLPPPGLDGGINGATPARPS